MGKDASQRDDDKVDGDKTSSTQMEKEVKIILFVKVKKETTLANMIALVIIPMITVAAGAYTNANMPYLLQSRDHFNVAFEKVGTRSGHVLFYALLIGTFLTPAFGYCYDLFGRRWLIISSLFIYAIQMSFLPHSAP